MKRGRFSAMFHSYVCRFGNRLIILKNGDVMKKNKIAYWLFCITLLLLNISLIFAADKWSLWSQETTLRGANIYQRRVYSELDGPTFLGSGSAGPPYTQEDFNRLAAWGANYVNISHPGLFTESPPYILDTQIQNNLDNLLSMIAQADMFAVISFRTGPGRSEFTFFWGDDGDWFDASYYNDQVWKEQAAQDAWGAMWQYTANRYKNNPIVVGYDLMVEPNSNEVWLDLWDQDEFYNDYGGTLYDWNQLYPDITSDIRTVDSETPILIGGMGYSNIDWLPYLLPTSDSKTVYTTHQYSPHVYTHQQGNLTKTYPGYFDTDWDGSNEQFNYNWIDNLFSIIDDFKTTHNVPVAVNEFGIIRFEPGAAEFMDDQMDLLEQRGLNYALWLWETSWQEYEQEVDDFNFRHGPNRNNHTDVTTSNYIEAIKSFWTQNTIRPSNFWISKYFVDKNHPSASDDNPGTQALPWQTIQHAVESISSGDTIVVQTGTYSGARIEQSGKAGSPIVLMAAEGSGVVLNNAGNNNKHDSILEIETWEGSGIVTHWVIQGFEIKNSLRYGIDIRETNNITIKNNYVHNSQSTGIFTAFCDDVTIENNESSNNGEHGIYYSNSGDRPIIRSNILHDNYGCGVHMNGDISMGGDGIISDGIVEKNTIYENGTGGGSGINMDGVTNTIIRNNLLYNNHASGISLYQIDGAVCSRNNKVLHNTIVMPNDGRWALNISNSGCTGNKVLNNILYNAHSYRGSILIPEINLVGFESNYNVLINKFSANGGNSSINLQEWQALGYDTNSSVATPAQLFLDAAANNYHLRAGSPAVNSGIAVAEVTDDIESTLRPVGLAPDIGAYESNFTGNIYYLSTSGNNSNDGLSPATAWQTLQYAVDFVSPGDSVYVFNGTYNSVTFNLSGTATSPISFKGESRDGVIVQGGLEFAKGTSYLNVNSFTVQDYSNWGVFVRGTNQYISFNDMFVTGGDCGFHLTWGYQAQDPIDGSVSHITIENSIVANCIYTAIDGTPGPCNNIVFKNIEIYGAGISGQSSWGADGIAIERGDYVTVEGCYVHDNGGDGVDINSRDFNGNSQGIVVTGNRILRNRMTGVKLWGGGKMENNVISGMGNAPVYIGAFPGNYEVINNTIAYNMQSTDYAVRNYSFVAAYPNDETGISAQINLTMLNNIFAFNCNNQMGGPTGIYLGEGVTLVSEGYNCYFSRNDGEIQAAFVQGETWFGRQQINDGTWQTASGQGVGNITVDASFNDYTNYDFLLYQGSPCINAGNPGIQYNDVNGTRNDMGAYGGPEGNSYDYPGPENSFTISGEIKYHTSEQNVNNAQLDLVGDATISTTSNESGTFQFVNIQGGQNYSISPSKQGDISSSTILSFDASLAARISINLLPNPTDFQIIAADVDLNDSVQMYDASMIVRHAVGLPPLSGIKTAEWTFDPMIHSYSPLNSNTNDADFTAIVLGDVDGNWSALGNLKNGLKIKNLNSVCELNNSNEDQVIFSIFSETGEEIYSCDVSLEYDSSVLKFLELKKTALSDHFYTMINDLESGKLRFGCYGTVPIVEPGKYLELVFEIIEKNSNACELKINSYRINADPERSGILTVVLGKDQPTKPDQFSLYQNYPNPFNSSTIIKYQLAKKCLVQLEIYDVLGRLLKTLVSSNQNAGQYEIVWDGNDNNGHMLSSGLYFYHIRAGEFQAEKKLLFMK